MKSDISNDLDVKIVIVILCYNFTREIFYIINKLFVGYPYIILIVSLVI